MKKKCRRTVRPLVNPIALAMEGAAVTAGHILDRLRMRELSAIEAFRTGQATVEDWRALADLVNVAETMAGMGIGHEVLPAAAAMQQHLDEAFARHEETGRVGLTGPGLQAARDLHEYHDLQRTSVGRSVYERAIQKTSDRIRSAHPDAKVLISERRAV